MKHVQTLRFSLLTVLAVTVVACNFLQLFGTAETPMVSTLTSTPRQLHTPKPTPTATPQAVTVIATDFLYLRSGPGMQYAVDNQALKWGDSLEFQGQCLMDATGTWWLHILTNGKDGWVSQRYVTPTVCK